MVLHQPRLGQLDVIAVALGPRAHIAAGHGIEEHEAVLVLDDALHTVEQPLQPRVLRRLLRQQQEEARALELCHIVVVVLVPVLGVAAA